MHPIAWSCVIALAYVVAACAPSAEYRLVGTSEAGGVRLAWDAAAAVGDETLVIERKRGADGWAPLVTVKGPGGEHLDWLPPSSGDRSYHYRIRRENGSGGSAPVAVILQGGAPDPDPTPTPSPTPRPTPTPVPPPMVTGSPGFQAEMEAALALLEQGDPAGFARYRTWTRTVVELPRNSDDFCAFASPTLRAISIYASCISHAPAGEERTRRLASVLVHEATHLAIDREGTRSLTVQFDAKWLADAVTDVTARYVAQERARLAGELAPEIRAAYRDCDAVLGSAEALIQRNPTASARAKQDVRDRAAAESARCRRAVDQQAAGIESRYAGALREEVRRRIERDWVSDYVTNLEHELGRQYTDLQRQAVVRSECWAQHEGLVTYAKLGGTSLSELNDVLFLNTPDCRGVLNLR